MLTPGLPSFVDDEGQHRDSEDPPATPQVTRRPFGRDWWEGVRCTVDRGGG